MDGFSPFIYPQDLQTANRRSLSAKQDQTLPCAHQPTQGSLSSPKAPKTPLPQAWCSLNLCLSREAVSQPGWGEAACSPFRSPGISKVQESLNSGSFIRPGQSKETFLSSSLSNTPVPLFTPHHPGQAPPGTASPPSLPHHPAMGWTKGKPRKLSSEEQAGPRPGFSVESERSHLETGQKTACFCSSPKPKERTGLAAV